MEIAKVGVRVGSRVEVRWEQGEGPFHATVVSCNDNDDLITVAYDDGDVDGFQGVDRHSSDRIRQLYLTGPV